MVSARMFRFRISGMILGMAVGGAVLGLVRIHTQDPPVVRKIRNMGHEVEYRARGRGLFGIRDRDIESITCGLWPSGELSEDMFLELAYARKLSIVVAGDPGSDVSFFPKSARFPRLQEFRFLCTQTKIDIEFLSDSIEMESLTLTGKPTDLRDLERMDNLRSLTFRFDEDVSLSPLKSLHRLEKLTIYVGPDERLLDVSPIAEMTGLEKLYITKGALSDQQRAALQKSLPNLHIVDWV